MADQYETDKNRITGHGHFYSRVYDKIFTDIRLSAQSFMEIGLCRGLHEGWRQEKIPPAGLWLKYFPFAKIYGVDISDFSWFDHERFEFFRCDCSNHSEVQLLASRISYSSMDVIIDDASHASFDQQLCFVSLFPKVRQGGLYIIEDLDWQPTNEKQGFTKTKRLFKELSEFDQVVSDDHFGISRFARDIDEIWFWDSHMELVRNHEIGGLLVIKKR